MLKTWEQKSGLRSTTLLLTLPLGILVCLLAAPMVSLPGVSGDVFAQNPWLERALRREGILPGLLLTTAGVSVATVAVMLLGMLGGLFRRMWALRCLRFCYALSYAGGAFYLWTLTRISDAIAQKTGITKDLEFAYVPGDGVHWASAYLGAFDFDQLESGLDRVTLFKWQWDWAWPIILFMLLIGLMHLLSWRSHAIILYRGHHDDSPEPGDIVVENIRTHGRAPAYRKNVYVSMLSHIMVILIIPWLMQFLGCVDPYRVPKGSGNPVVAVVQVKKPKKEKKKQYILNPNSLIALKVPDIDESEIYKEVEEQTQLTYKATSSAKAGRMGKGGGKTGGWPDGMEDALVRFIRLKHGGPDWDDGMDAAQGADSNFLAEFKRLTGFNVAPKGEAHAISLLKKYPPGYAPPFVYLTGSGSIRASSGDIKALRDYLIDGGMVFADAGSPGFDRSFRHFARQIMPGYNLLNIADDDPLFMMPYAFPHGAPPLWHHGGKRALGLKYKNRWVCFYHPGDVNDAWKHGASGLSRKQAEGAYQVGVNVAYYAFTNYLELTRKYRR
jgi:hypothetical protein